MHRYTLIGLRNSWGLKEFLGSRYLAKVTLCGCTLEPLRAPCSGVSSPSFKSLFHSYYQIQDPILFYVIFGTMLAAFSYFIFGFMNRQQMGMCAFGVPDAADLLMSEAFSGKVGQAAFAATSLLPPDAPSIMS